MALIGNGAQSEFQALAFHHLLGIEEIQALRHRPRRDRQADAQSAPPGPCASTLRDSTRDAVRGADIVTTVTADKTNATILTPT